MSDCLTPEACQREFGLIQARIEHLGASIGQVHETNAKIFEKLDKILVQTTKTNGNVVRNTEDITGLGVRVVTLENQRVKLIVWLSLALVSGAGLGKALLSSGIFG